MSSIAEKLVDSDYSDNGASALKGIEGGGFAKDDPVLLVSDAGSETAFYVDEYNETFRDYVASPVADGSGVWVHGDHRSYPATFPNGTVIDRSLDTAGAGYDPNDPAVLIPHILKCTVLILIITVAIFSNILVVISVFRYHKLRHINNYFLVSLAVADLFVAFFAMTFNASVEITGKWNFGYVICDLWNSLDVHFSTVSTLHLCCISVDRYYAIVKPLKYTSHMTVKVAFTMIGIAWIAPMFISFLPIFMGWYTTDDHEQWRTENPTECIFRVNKPYALLSSGLTFWLPVVVMLVMYHRIYREALRQKEAIRRSSVPSQQHLIVDSDQIRSRFQELQAKGFRTKKGISAMFAGAGAHMNGNAAVPRSNSRLSINPVGAAGRGGSGALAPPEIVVGDIKSPSSTSPGLLAPPGGPPPNVINGNSNGSKNGPAPEGEDPERARLLGGGATGGGASGAAGDECETHFGSDTVTVTATVPPSPSVGRAQETTAERRVSTHHQGRSSSMAGSNSLTPPSLAATNSTTLGSMGNPNGRRRVSMANSTASEGLRERHRIHTSWRKEHKAFVTLGIVMGAFLICWMPFFIWYLTVTLCGDGCPCPDVVVSILFWIGYFNSTLNPVIYVMTNRDFKDAFTDILRRIFCVCCPNEGNSGGRSGDHWNHSNVDFV